MHQQQRLLKKDLNKIKENSHSAFQKYPKFTDQNDRDEIDNALSSLDVEFMHCKSIIKQLGEKFVINMEDSFINDIFEDYQKTADKMSQMLKKLTAKLKNFEKQGLYEKSLQNLNVASDAPVVESLIEKSDALAVQYQQSQRDLFLQESSRRNEEYRAMVEQRRQQRHNEKMRSKEPVVADVQVSHTILLKNITKEERLLEMSERHFILLQRLLNLKMA